MIHPYRSVVPKVHPSVWVADSAHVVGDVELGEDASVWFGSVLSGDVNVVRIHRLGPPTDYLAAVRKG